MGNAVSMRLTDPLDPTTASLGALAASMRAAIQSTHDVACREYAWMHEVSGELLMCHSHPAPFASALQSIALHICRSGSGPKGGGRALRSTPHGPCEEVGSAVTRI